MNEVANRIFELIKSKKLTQREFAERCGLNDKVVHQWKNGSKSYRKYLPQIASTLGTTVDYILNGNDANKCGTISDLLGEKISPAEDGEADMVATTPAERKLLRLLRSIPEEKQDRLMVAIETVLRTQELL